MQWSVHHIRVVGLSLLLVALLVVWVPQVVPRDLLANVLWATGVECRHDYLRVHFLDIGQGDAIFIETPDCVQMLVDGGVDRQVLNRLAEVMSPLDRQIDMVVGTHPHADHIGGLVDVLQRFQVDHILVTEKQLPTQVSDRFFAAVDRAAEDGSTVWYARAGQTFALGASTTVDILSPRYDPTEMDADVSSIVTHIHYGDTAIMLTGDAPVVVEDYLVEVYGSGLRSDIFKLGHHGSRTSSGELFLDTVQPRYAVTSAGVDNRHGHPHAEVVERVLERGITHVSTQDRGTITFKSDGTRVWLQGE